MTAANIAALIPATVGAGSQTNAAENAGGSGEIRTMSAICASRTNAQSAIYREDGTTDMSDKPVAWQYRWKLDGEWTDWRVSDASQKSPYLRDLEERPLYTRPASSVACQHEPFEGACVHCGVPFVRGKPLASGGEK